MKNLSGGFVNKKSNSKLEDIVDSYFDCNPKDKRNVFQKRPKCFYCEVKDAVWENSILNEYCCNECVPRGCSCRLFKIKKSKLFSVSNYAYMRNEFYEELPCEDWHIF